MIDELSIKEYQPYNDKKVYIVKDKFGNAATGHTLEEAINFLKNRIKIVYVDSRI